jgi:hypothetical protein
VGEIFNHVRNSGNTCCHFKKTDVIVRGVTVSLAAVTAPIIGQVMFDQ